MAEAPRTSHPAPSERSFAVFAFAWGLSAVVNTGGRLDLDAGRLVFLCEAATIACGACVMARPSSLARLLALALVHTAMLWGEMPRTYNHGLLMLVLEIAALASFAISARRFDAEGRRDFYAAFAPIARASLLVLYVWTTVHKLNWSFVDPDLSCASSEVVKLREHTVFGVSLAFLPGGRGAEQVAIWGTLLIEGGIPCLLAFRRTRLAGVLLAALFHYVLGFSYPGFSAMLYALLALFLPSSTWDALPLGANDTLARIGRLVRGTLELAALAWIVFAVVRAFSDEPEPASLSPAVLRAFWLAYGLLALGALAFVSRRAAIGARVSADALRILPRPIYLPFVALVFANGLTPYVGLKTTLCYAMFSNLSTEGGRSNHMFIPESWLVFDLERDLVSIRSSSDEVLHALSVPSWSGAPKNETFAAFFRPTEAQKLGSPPVWRLPYQALRQRITYLARHGAVSVRLVYERGGEVHRLSNAERDPDLATLPYLASKLLFLRAVPDIEGCCMW